MFCDKYLLLGGCRYGWRGRSWRILMQRDVSNGIGVITCTQRRRLTSRAADPPSNSNCRPSQRRAIVASRTTRHPNDEPILNYSADRGVMRSITRRRTAGRSPSRHRRPSLVVGPAVAGRKGTMTTSSNNARRSATLRRLYGIVRAWPTARRYILVKSSHCFILRS